MLETRDGVEYYNGSSYTFTWNGRELAKAVKGGVTTTYKYGADGMRTEKKTAHDLWFCEKGDENMKKKIIIGIFSALIFITAVIFITMTISACSEIESGIDGLAALFLLLVGGFIVLCELDLFCTVYYFFVKPKTIAKSILNILSTLSLVFVFVVDMKLRAYEFLGIISLAVYCISRLSYLVILSDSSYEENYKSGHE
jgi:hypothetical protein